MTEMAKMEKAWNTASLESWVSKTANSRQILYGHVYCLYTGSCEAELFYEEKKAYDQTEYLHLISNQALAGCGCLKVLDKRTRSSSQHVCS